MGPFHPYAVRPPPPQTEGKAVVSLVLGLLSMTCAFAILGLPAIVFGALARRDIDRSSGLLTGRTLAASGIVSGLFGTGIGFVMVLWVLGSAFAPPTEASEETAETAAALTAPIADEPAPPSVPAPIPSGTRSFGSLEVIDLDRSRPLRAQLAEIVRRAHGRTVVLQTFARSSTECAAIDAALPDKRMQRALANVTLVRVDVDEYDRELGTMKVETRSAPWFYKLDAKGNPTDAISAESWEACVPETMAPILGRFVKRTAPTGRRAAH